MDLDDLIENKVLIALAGLVLVAVIAWSTGYLNPVETTSTTITTTTQTTIPENRVEDASELLKVMGNILRENPERVIDMGDSYVLILPSRDAVEFSKDGKETAILLNRAARAGQELEFTASDMSYCSEDAGGGDLCVKDEDDVELEILGLFPQGYARRSSRIDAYSTLDAEMIDAMNTTEYVRRTAVGGMLDVG
ncbi:MAG: hypothetical protein ABIH11_05550 [Candidatus Altiarchaeota archaeon]